MVTVTEFLTMLVESLVKMTQIFANDVALYDPLSTISLIVGAVLTTLAMAVFGYLVLGSVAEFLGVGTMR